MPFALESFQKELEALCQQPVSAEQAQEGYNNLLGFMSTLIEINKETKVVKNAPDDK